jgi:hypothetical protein
MAHRHVEIFNQLGSCSATESKSNSYQHLCRPNRSPRIGRSTGGKAFAEDFACAIWILAAKATHFYEPVQSLTTHRQVSPVLATEHIRSKKSVHIGSIGSFSLL